jgi:hypothetical protein
MIREAEKHADDTAQDRIDATDYYNGVMRDLPPDKGRSSMTTKDVRSHIKKALPSIVRTILGSDEVVEYQPVSEGDEEGAQQASDFINFVVFPEANGRKACIDAIHDALLLKNGILRWWYDERQAVKFSRHSGLTEQELSALTSEDGVEVVDVTEAVEQVETPEGVIDLPTYDAKIKRAYTDKKYRIAAVPRERFLIHPDAVTLDDSLLTGERMELRRSDLIAMGYDRELVMGLALADEDDEERDTRRGDSAQDDTDEADPANDPIDYYEVFVRVDMDGDGIAELRRMCFAGALNEHNKLVDEEVDEVQFADLTAMFQPHQWEGVSLADDLADLQRAKTALLRQTLDNIYWQNNTPMFVNIKAVQNPDAIMNPQFGQAVLLKDGMDARTVVQFNPVPFVANHSLALMESLDREAEDRTGITDASSGLAPDALQNMTAKASAMIEQAGIGQTEMMVRNLAEGMRRMFRGLLRMTIRHQDKPRTVRLRDEWVEFDPRHWNADMDATVNVGLGAGTRERDMMVMHQVLALQEKLIAAFGSDNPFVKPDQLYNSLAKLVESAGLKTPSLFFSEPDPQEIQQRMAEAKTQPNPEMEKAKAEMALKQADMQGKMQLEQAKMQASQAKEKAQMEADLVVRQKEIEAESIRQREELQSAAALQAQNLQWEREKFQMELQLRREEMDQRRQDEIMRYQADQMRTENQSDGAVQ